MSVICNPLDLPYRYQDFGRGPFRAVYRESADPSIVHFGDRYYLFASMSGGFFHSLDLTSWTFERAPWLAVGDYAPDARVVDDHLVVTASRRRETSPFFSSPEPLRVPFRAVAQSAFPHYDPNLFQDDDGRKYLYWGCSNDEPLRGIEVDDRLQPIGDAVDLIGGQPQQRGWERPGESNVSVPPRTLLEKLSARIFGTHGTEPYIEGAWLTKHRDQYYLQYAGPGTEYNVYADGYATAATPLGPFEYSPHSPFSSKPGGFLTGAGHGSTFQDRFGNWWHAATMRISVNHHFERRIGLFPAGFDDDGVLFCNQNFGDYPMTIPTGPADPWTEISTGWMLQSFRAETHATSSANGHGAELAVNEDVRSWWAAGTDSPGEALTVDLETSREVHAIQVNLADHDTTAHKPRRALRDPAASKEAFRTVAVEDIPTRYRLDVSLDGTRWETVHDGSKDDSDSTHRLVRLEAPTHLRFVRVTGVSTPWGSTFAISGLRVFGYDQRRPPAAAQPTAARLEARTARISWPAAPGAEGYNVRYGLRPDRLYHSWQVWAAEELVLPSLTVGQDYWVAVDSYNAGGVTHGEAHRVGEL